MRNIFKPKDGYAPFYQSYMNNVPEDGNLLQHLADIDIETKILISGLSEKQLNYSYSEGKWTIKDILVHLADSERIFIYRATRIARSDKTTLPGFNEALFAFHANANNRTSDDILKELKALRISSLAFIQTLDEDALDRTGTANGFPMSARFLVNLIYGHHKHHLMIIHERYLSQNAKKQK